MKVGFALILLYSSEFPRFPDCFDADEARASTFDEEDDIQKKKKLHFAEILSDNEEQN